MSLFALGGLCVRKQHSCHAGTGQAGEKKSDLSFSVFAFSLELSASSAALSPAPCALPPGASPILPSQVSSPMIQQRPRKQRAGRPGAFSNGCISQKIPPRLIENPIGAPDAPMALYPLPLVPAGRNIGFCLTPGPSIDAAVRNVPRPEPTRIKPPHLGLPRDDVPSTTINLSRHQFGPNQLKRAWGGRGPFRTAASPKKSHQGRSRIR